ncbi:MAG: hypothetical protein HYX26_08320 [Acidobacteriales bacterium]|nr:hypothetical protein [Terriglobales bacterium]
MKHRVIAEVKSKGKSYRREYVLHYATARPFAQYAVRVRLSAAEREALEERLARMVEEGSLHSFHLADLKGMERIGKLGNFVIR